ncbi:hypothetical protein [Ruminococcus sp. JL13D9]|uniref:hypothetical protein n=1 Tax=Ruminococcus sp. JL13D9 TaxID=3233381 RepID=UPI00389B1763
MKLKNLAAVILAASTALLCGCNIADLSFEESLRPPRTMGDEAEIEKLISKTAGSNYTLKYPKSGSYRSAIIMNDLNGDGVDEAIAFFKGKDETAGVHMLLMYDQDGEWKTSGDYVTETTDVDCVDFADIDENNGLEIIVGYTTYTPNVNFLACYTYSNGVTDTIQAGQNYSSFYCGNLDNNGKSEIITLSLFSAENQAKASMLSYSKEKKQIFVKASAPMDPNVVKIKSIGMSDFDGSVKGVVVDGSFASEELVTQVIYYNQTLAVLRNPLYKEKQKNPTTRTVGVLSTDFDGDSKLEIPMAEKLPFHGEDMALTVADKISWCSFNPANETLTVKSVVAENRKCGFSVKQPSKWVDRSYTAINDENSMKLYEWVNNALGEELFEVKAFDVSAWDKGKIDGFTLIYRDNRYAYAFTNPQGKSPMKLTDDEIKTAFSVTDNRV